jgi:L-lactate dehydrogenase (cytochrome)
MRRALRLACCFEDLQALARSRIPKPFYDYADAGSWSEATYRANERDFAGVLLRQKVLVDIERRNVRSEMLGRPVAMPLALAPCGFGGMMWGDGEIAAAQAAEEFGVPFTLSTMSINSIEDVAANTTAPFMFQLYVMRDRGYVKSLIGRAKAAKCSALVLTADLQVIGQRHKDIKNGLSLPPEPTLKSVVHLVSRPSWCLSQAKAKRWNFGNIIGHHPLATSMMNLAEFTAAQFDPTLNWCAIFDRDKARV